MDYWDNGKNTASHHPRWTTFTPPRWSNFVPPLTGRYVTFQMAEVAVPRRMFGQILAHIARLRAPPVPA